MDNTTSGGNLTVTNFGFEIPIQAKSFLMYKIGKLFHCFWRNLIPHVFIGNFDRFLISSSIFI